MNLVESRRRPHACGFYSAGRGQMFWGVGNLAGVTVYLEYRARYLRFPFGQAHRPLPDVIRICEESDADADAGRVVPATSVHAKIDAALAAMREEPPYSGSGLHP